MQRTAPMPEFSDLGNERKNSENRKYRKEGKRCINNRYVAMEMDGCGRGGADQLLSNA